MLNFLLVMSFVQIAEFPDDRNYPFLGVAFCLHHHLMFRRTQSVAVVLSYVKQRQIMFWLLGLVIYFKISTKLKTLKKAPEEICTNHKDVLCLRTLAH